MSELPVGWANVALEDVVDILDSQRVPVNQKEREKRPGPVPYYGATGQVGWVDELLFDEELVLLGEDGAPFLDPFKPKAYIIDGPSWVNNHAHVLRAVAGLTTNRFLKYALDHIPYREYVNGTTRLKLTQKSMRAMRLPLPPPEEQERIVAAIEEHLSRLDAIQSLLKHLSARLQILGDSIIQDQLDGQWDCVPLGDFAEANGITDGPFGSKLKTSHYTDIGPRVIRLGNIGRGQFIDEMTHISHSHFSTLRRHEAQAGDLVVASLVSDHLRACLVPSNVGPAVVKADCIRVRPRQDMDARFLNYSLMRPSLRSFVSHHIRGVGRSRLGLANVRNIPVPSAPPDDQRRIADTLDNYFSSIKRLRADFQAAGSRSDVLRRAVLNAAFNGKLAEQDPTDEPASILLDRIRSERAMAYPKRRTRTAP